MKAIFKQRFSYFSVCVGALSFAALTHEHYVTAAIIILIGALIGGTVEYLESNP